MLLHLPESMSTEEAIQKAKNLDLGKELGVSIDPASVVPKDSLIRTIPDRLAEDTPGELLVDLDQPDAGEYADLYLACLLEAARMAIQEIEVSALYAADIQWVEIPDKILRRGLYRITLLAPKPKEA